MQLVYGINPLLEILKGNDRIIKHVIVATGNRREQIQQILNLARKAGIPVEVKEKIFLDKRSGGKNHQGVIGLVEDFAYASMDHIIANHHWNSKKDVILLLDGITDPQNLGSLIRTAHCFGVNGVVIPKDRSAPVTAAAMKVSSGAAGYTPIAMEINLVKTIENLQEKGFWIYGADVEDGQSVHTLKYGERIAVVMGSEGKGIRPLVKKKCDFLVSIPMKGEIDSLNVSVAAGIILYEISGVKDVS